MLHNFWIEMNARKVLSSQPRYAFNTYRCNVNICPCDFTIITLLVVTLTYLNFLLKMPLLQFQANMPTTVFKFKMRKSESCRKGKLVSMFPIKLPLTVAIFCSGQARPI